jgi:hypothetical protein
VDRVVGTHSGLDEANRAPDGAEPDACGLTRGALTRGVRCTSARLKRRAPDLADPGRLLCHLSYEESEMVESLARLVFFAGQV